MKKIVSIIMISTFALTSCFGGGKKFEELPTEKQEAITTQVETKISEWVKAIDMSAYTSEDSLTEENIKKITEQVDQIVKDSIAEVKKTEWDFDSTTLEERLLKTEVSKATTK